MRNRINSWAFAVSIASALLCCRVAAAQEAADEQPAAEQPATDQPQPGQGEQQYPPGWDPSQGTPTVKVVDPTQGTPTVKPADPRDEMDLAIDLGGGLLEFFHLDITWLINRKWSVGIGAGVFPIDLALRKLMQVDDLSASATLAGLTLAGDVQTQLGSGRLFGRWYPWAKRFFTELTVEMWRMRVIATGTLDYEGEGIEEELLEIETTATVWVPMVGLHAGWRFLWESGFYIDIAGGVNLLLSPGAEVTLGGATVEDLQEYPEAAAMLEDAQEFLSEELKQGANRITKKIKVFPTAAIRFGWAFDFW
jgi:hypothetical protein